MVKLSKKPRDLTRQNDVRTKLHTVLRCLHLALQSFHRHLPYSGGHVFGPPVYKIIELFKEVAKQSKTIGYETEASDMKEDAIKLFNAAKAFEMKFKQIKEKPLDYKEAISPKPARKSVKRPKTPVKKQLHMINNLAKERFGEPLSEEGHNSKSQALVVTSKNQRVSKIHEFHKSVTKNVLTPPKAQFHNEEVHLTEKSNSTMMDGISLGHDNTNHFANIDNIRDDVEKVEESKSIEIRTKNSSKRSMARKVEKYQIQEKRSISPHESRISPIFENVLSKSNERLFRIGNQKGLTILDIEDHELIEIENHKRSRIEHDVVINPPAYANPVEFVSKIADNLILKIVNNVCHEAIEEDLVQKLVQAELKSFG